MTQPLISGFMIAWNTASQGYPFVEAIRSALPLCDEFLVSDGGSTDETWQALECLRDRYPKQIALFRDPWPKGSNRDKTLATMINILRVRCSGRYIFNLQANEVIHESSVEPIRDLIGQWPQAPLFRLPFLNIIGARLLWMIDHRRRLAVNRSDIISLADGFDLGPDPSLACRVRRRIKQQPSAAHNAWLSEPVYRYRVLFPTDYIRRLETATTRSLLWKRELEFARATYVRFDPAADSPDDFWRQMRAYFDGAMFENLPPGVAVPPSIPRRCAGEIAGAPAIVKPLFGRWTYPLQESLKRVP